MHSGEPVSDTTPYGEGIKGSVAGFCLAAKTITADDSSAPATSAAIEVRPAVVMLASSAARDPMRMET